VSHRPDILIAGGGIGGLAVGALLAKAGRRVLLLERSLKLGGRAPGDPENGFTPSGALLLAQQSPLMAILKRLGRTVPFVEGRLDQFWRCTGGRLHALPGSPAALMRSQLLPLASKAKLVRLHTQIMATRPETVWEVPFGEWLRRSTRDERVIRLALDNAQALHYTDAPASISAGHAIELIQQIVRAGPPPSLLPAGGWGAFFRVFQEEIERSGGEARTDVAIDAIELSGGGSATAGKMAVGLRAGGERWTASAVVAALPVQELGPLLPAETPFGERLGRWAALEPTAGVSLELGVEGVANDRIGALDLPGEGVAIACYSLWDRSLAPPGAHLIQALRFLSRDEIRDPAVIAGSKDLLLQRIGHHFPGATQRVALQRFRVHQTLTGVRHTAAQSRPHLPPVAPPEVPGLYLVSDTTDAPGELADIAAAAALIAADKILAQGW
jgi:phytoene dehydrogenase-like protein